MQKVFQRINWQNYPSEETPLNESNLNRMDYALDEIDDRVIALDTEKAEQTTVDNLVKSIAVDDETGVITITKENGSQTTIQTTLNKIAINFDYDYTTQELILTLNDGTEARIDLSSLIQNNEFANTPTINLTVSQAGIVTGEIILHSIGDEHLRTDYLADIRLAEAHADASQQAAESFSLDSEAWAKGTRAAEPVEEGADGYNDNSKYYKDRSEAWAVGKVDHTPVPIDDECYENNSKHYSEVSASIRDATAAIRDNAADLLQSAIDRLTGLNLMVNYSDGCLYYDINSGIRLQINYQTGSLEYEIIT